MFKPKPKTKAVRGQLNVDVGEKRRERLRKYCKRERISITSCVKQMLDHCMGERDERREER